MKYISFCDKCKSAPQICIFSSYIFDTLNKQQRIMTIDYFAQKQIFCK